MTTHNLLSRYRPTNIKEFVGNKVLIKNLLESLRTHPCYILLIGPSGGGKTCVCSLSLDQYDYDVLKINGDETEDLKSLKRLVDNFMNNKTIESFFSKRKKLVFIDDVDILMSCDRNVNTFLMGFIDEASKSGRVSVILTCSSSEEKRLTELKKKISCIRLTNPSQKDVFAYITNILDIENFQYDHMKLLKLIDVHNNNIRNIFNNFHHLSLNDVEMKAEKQHKLLFDSNVFDVMKKLFFFKMSVNDFKLVSDNNIIPLLLYENFPNELFKNRVKQTKSKYCDAILYINDMFIDSEIQEQFMYQNTEWSLHDNITILKCGSINYQMTKYDKKKTKTFDEYIFTQVLTKAALRCNYGKKMLNLKRNFGMYDLKNIYYVLDCIAKLVMSSSKEELCKLHFPKDLNISADDIATIYQYFSQFLGMDKNLLNKIKKLL